MRDNEWKEQAFLDHNLNVAKNALRRGRSRRPEGVEASNIVSIGGSLLDSASEREIARRVRDHDRGYSINVKQVVLAFVVEFFIIGLILVGQYLIAEETAKEKAFAILLFPIGLATIELGRVPLAIAVRTQNAWSVKCLAGLGVAAAVVVTFFSLSTIAYQTFEPRLADVNEKSNILHDLQATKAILVNEIDSAANVVKQKRSDRDSINQRFNELQSQISKLGTAKGESCSTTTGVDGATTKHCTPVATINRAQLKTLQDQLVNTKKDLEDAESAVSVAEASLAKLDSRPIDEKIAKAQNEYRVAIGRSQLHAYTSMIKSKAPSEVTDSDIKSVELYLIFIPSLAGALASTLLAITAVRRIRPSARKVEAIKKQAEDAVAAAMAEKANSEFASDRA